MQPGWEEVADFVAVWLKRLPRTGIERLSPAGMEPPSLPARAGLLSADTSNPILE